MHLTLDIFVEESYYTIRLTISHKNSCILRLFFKSIISDTIDDLKKLSLKLKRLYHTHAPLELFAQPHVCNGNSLSISFANNAFLVGTTNIANDIEEASSNYIYLLRNIEVIQFHTEIMGAISKLDVAIDSLILAN